MIYLTTLGIDVNSIVKVKSCTCESL